MAGNINSFKYKNVLLDDSEDEEDAGNDCGLSLEKLNLGPRKKLLVLCLGGLLVHRVYRYDYTTIPQHRLSDAAYGSFLVYKRPFCDEFVKFCFERFEVGLWSSAREWYIDNALDCAMRGLRGKLLFIWDQNECTDSGFKTLEKKDKPLYLKELKKLWEVTGSSLPWRKGQYTSSNTLMIDDTPYKALLNPPNTAIFPTQYEAEHVNDTALGPKGALRLYLDGLADADDVPSYVEKHPFGQPAITPTHTNWDYYSMIIRKFHKE
ncbi:hypothetical protein L1049_008920 [Liquidambar formosana]|uniref:Mitochondrial import inner membrane translocase subunit TIM50 n=1 Tax=Liquidambar formosana TaxID=63359 RepID=A0AAP0S7S1_LIQFO